MGVFGPRADTMELMSVSKILGVFYTVPRSELAASRKAWVRAWKSTGVEAGPFLVHRYGMQVDGDDVVPTRGAALFAPLYWEPADHFGPDSAARFVRDVRAGKFGPLPTD